MRVSWLLLMVPALAVSACGRVGFESAPLDGASDASTREDATPIDATLTPTNLLPNPGCEDDSAWFSFQGQFYYSDLARSGQRACGACIDVGFGVNTIDQVQSLTTSIAMGETYVGSVYARAEPGQSGQEAFLKIREWTRDNQKEGPDIEGERIVLSESWQRLEVAYTIQNDTSETVDMYLVQIGSAGDCVLADDFLVYRQ